MHTETHSYKRRLNVWAFSIWIFGGLIALGLMCVLEHGGSIYSVFKCIVTSTTNIDTFLWSVYYSIPFFVLGALTKIYFQRQNLFEKVFFARVLQITCGFIMTEYFYYAFATYVKGHGHMFSPLLIIAVVLPFVALLPLFLGLLIGGLLSDVIIFLFPVCFSEK